MKGATFFFIVALLGCGQANAQIATSPAYSDAQAQAANAPAITAASAKTLPVFDITGVTKTPSHVVVGSYALVAGTYTVTLLGSAVFTSAASYFCSSSDQSTTASLSTIRNVTGTSFIITGVLTDTVSFSCMGW